MKELSVFIDESGDFGEIKEQPAYYLVTFVFHDQDNGIDERRKLLYKMLNFVNKCPISYLTVIVDRKGATDKIALSGRLAKAINRALSGHIEFRKTEPQKYRLLQAADFICTMELLRLKREEKRLSKSEKCFSIFTLKKKEIYRVACLV